jgi:RNA-directed DNA polymerase
MVPSAVLCKRFAFSLEQLYVYAQTCPYRYKTYEIDKRNGGKRKISQPSKDLKVIQRYILAEFLESHLKVHDSAKAYKINTNILDNARPHLKNNYLLKMDFKEFFPSIIDTDFIQYLMELGIVNDLKEAQLLSRIFFKQEGLSLRLSIGSPGSPIISNALLFSFDEIVTKECLENGISYTRYSDDLTFSTNHRGLLFDWPERVGLILKNIGFPTLEINRKKNSVFI